MPVPVVSPLRDNGRDDDYHAVSAALAHLKKAERARQEVRGQWVIWVHEPAEPSIREDGVAVPDYAKGRPPGGPTGMELIQRNLKGWGTEENRG